MNCIGCTGFSDQITDFFTDVFIGFLRDDIRRGSILHFTQIDHLVFSNNQQVNLRAEQSLFRLILRDKISVSQFNIDLPRFYHWYSKKNKQYLKEYAQ